MQVGGLAEEADCDVVSAGAVAFCVYWKDGRFVRCVGMCGEWVLVTWLGNVSDELGVVFISFFFFGTLGRLI